MDVKRKLRGGCLGYMPASIKVAQKGGCGCQQGGCLGYEPAVFSAPKAKQQGGCGCERKRQQGGCLGYEPSAFCAPKAKQQGGCERKRQQGGCLGYTPAVFSAPKAKQQGGCGCSQAGGCGCSQAGGCGCSQAGGARKLANLVNWRKEVGKVRSDMERKNGSAVPLKDAMLEASSRRQGRSSRVRKVQVKSDKKSRSAPMTFAAAERVLQQYYKNRIGRLH